MRLSGGSIIKKMYTRLMKIFNSKSAKGQKDYEEYKSSTSMIFPQNCEEQLFKFSEFQPRYVYQDEESDYNLDSPTNKKVVEARKQWQATMAKLRKDIETEIQKLNEPILERIKENQTSKQLIIKKTNDSKNGKDNEATKKAPKSKVQQDTDIDWVQFLPVWNVKKIFAYLDEKTLYNLRNVNDYWATISKEVLVEKKARDYLDSAIKKSVEFLDNLLDISPDRTEVEIEEKLLVTQPSGFKKRKEKERRTATSIRRKEYSENLHNKSVLSECFKEFDTHNATFLTKLKSFPTGITDHLTSIQNESINISSGEVTSMQYQEKLMAESKSPHGSELDKMSSTASIMSLVPSIVVAAEDMKTW